MVNAQEWLNNKYLKEERSKITEIYLDEPSLEGELDLSDFTYWFGSGIGIEIYIYPSVDETKITFKNKPRDAKINKLQNAQQWLESQEECNTKEKRAKIKELDIKQKNLKGALDLSDFVNLEVLNCWYNKLTELNLNNCSNLKELTCERNQLICLDLTNLNNLEKISCGNNKLTNLYLSSSNSNLTTLYCSGNRLTTLDFVETLNPEKLESLAIGDNNFSKFDLTIFNKFINLGSLEVRNNDFTGSLQPLEKLNKLWHLDISDTDIDRGLEYLPRSIKIFDCSFLSRPNARVSDIWEELQPFEKSKTKVDRINDGGLKNWRRVKWDKQLPLAISPLLPPQLIGENKQKSKFAELVRKVQRQERENKLLANISDIDYKEIRFENWPRNNKNEISSFEQLPTRLYNIKEDKVEETKNNPNIKNYAILSYVWGNPNIKATEATEKENWWKNNLTVSGNKSLQKAIQTCKLLGINYIWIDQLCIIQKGEEAKRDKENEIPKMRQYYSNSEVTLIALNDEIGDISDIDLMDILRKVVNSEWFTRSWTFQEGWLSKQTIFMFDDKLIDGRAMAGIWALNQLGYVGEGRYNSRREFDKGSKKIATPVGWTYYRDGYTENDKVTMTLNQALKEIKARGRGIPVDGVYSILGLLPYGEYVSVKYKSNLCKECKKIESEQQKEVICKHPEEKRTEWPTYFVEEINQVLKEVMKVAAGYRETEEIVEEVVTSDGESYSVKEKIGYWDEKIERFAECIGWHGSSNSALGLGWMPHIDENGSTNIEGSIEIKINKNSLFSISEKGIELYTTNYQIQKIDSDIYKRESGFEVEGGLYERKVKVKQKNKMIELILLGTKKNVELLKENIILSLPYKSTYISIKPFALLLRVTGEKGEGEGWHQGDFYPIYHRLGLVEIGVGNEKLEREEQWIIISSQKLQEQQSQIQILPKGNY